MKCTAVKVQAVQTKAGATIALNVGHQKVRGKSMIVRGGGRKRPGWKSDFHIFWTWCKTPNSF